MHQEILAKAADLTARHTIYGGKKDLIPYCTLGMIDPQGYPTASAVTAAKADGIQSFYFCTGLASNKVKRLALSNKVSLCFCTEHYNITLTGTLEVLTSPDIKKEMWYPPLEHHFSGYEDPAYCVLKFSTLAYNLFIDGQELRGMLA